MTGSEKQMMKSSCDVIIGTLTKKLHIVMPKVCSVDKLVDFLKLALHDLRVVCVCVCVCVCV